MTKYENFKLEFLSRLKSCGAESYPFKPYELAKEFNIEAMHIRETLIQWHNEGLFLLYVGSRHYTDPYWESMEAFFEAGNKDGYVRAKLLASGDEELERLQQFKQQPIGFRA